MIRGDSISHAYMSICNYHVNLFRGSFFKYNPNTDQLMFSVIVPASQVVSQSWCLDLVTPSNRHKYPYRLVAAIIRISIDYSKMVGTNDFKLLHSIILGTHE